MQSIEILLILLQFSRHASITTSSLPFYRNYQAVANKTIDNLTAKKRKKGKKPWKKHIQAKT